MELEAVEPASTVVWYSLAFDGCVAQSCCPSTQFFCSDDHLTAWRAGNGARTTGDRLNMREALEIGIALFEPLLRPGAAATTASERMPQQRTDDEGYPDRRRQQPVADRRQLLPQRQALAVVDIECGQQKNVGKAHACDVQAHPSAPTLSPGGPSQRCGDERQQSEDEQVIVFGPANHGQTGCRYEHHDKGPIVDRSESRMATAALGARHRDCAGDNADKTDQDVQGHHSQEHRRGRRYGDSRDDSRFLGGHGAAVSSLGATHPIRAPSPR